MRRCHRCKSQNLQPLAVEDTVEVDGYSFTAHLPATVCGQCGESYISGPALERFELEIARRLASAGIASAAVARHLRNTLSLSGVQLAELLDVTPETVSRWENGKIPIERRAMALLSAMVLDLAEERSTTRSALEALREPQTLGRRVAVEIPVGAAPAS